MDYILEIDCNLSPVLCEKMIQLFELDKRKAPGLTMSGDLGTTLDKVKLSTDLIISSDNSFDEWGDIDKVLKNKLTEGLEKYGKHLFNIYKGKSVNWKTSLANTFNTMRDCGYQIQRTNKGEYYDWHNDEHQESNRTITFLWYLNTLNPNVDGGTTEFECGKSIVPTQGKLILFPATWTYTHRGSPVLSDNSKYICTGWIHSK
tara:strand:- start:289 stop:897 length:609 start_codon:yes stop_codon:yes gene_type:complete